MPTKAEKLVLAGVAAKLGADPASLDRLIQFESRWNPAARNPISGARGLIQFTNTTARSMGYGNADALVQAHPSVISQLSGPVYRYLAPLAPFPTPQSLYMAVFYPKARAWSEDTPFPENVRKVNPGIVTVRDYIRKVESAGTGKVVAGGLSIAAIVAAFMIYNNLTKGVSNVKKGGK